MVLRIFFAVVLASLWMVPASAASGAQCREMSIDQDDGSTRMAKMCLGEDGAWYPASDRAKAARAVGEDGAQGAAQDQPRPIAAATSGEVQEAGQEAGPALTRRLDNYVAIDARGWAFNHYDAGSMHDVRIAEGSAKTGTMMLRGDYTFNGGNAGWVIARLVGGKLDCIQFWDAAIGCRPLRTEQDGARQRGLAAGVMASLMDGGGGGSSQSSSDETARFNGWVQNNRNAGLNDNGTPR